jgi:1-acyl-sn-glycerol-3-phosphate acyltransferase
MTRKPIQSASGDWSWPWDQYDSSPARRTGQFWKTLDFEAPRYSPLAWRIASAANRIFCLGFGGSAHGSITPILPESALAELRSIPQGAGNILVGPHPGPLDAHLMFHLLGAAHRGPAVFLMAAESYFGGTALRRSVLNRLGVIPVARGRKNPEAVRMMSELIASGWWGGIFPEGEVYFSRQVMPMEDGAIRIAIDAALDIQRMAEEEGQDSDLRRRVFLTPFAHVYFFKNPKQALRRAEKALRELEAHPMIAVSNPQGNLPTRLRRAADRLLENKADEYGVPREEWRDDDRFERTRKLQDAVLRRLEKDYLGQVGTGYVRRRASRVRMACFERLADSEIPELILMTPFNRAYRESHNDLEMWVEYLCRFRSALDMPPFNFGPQIVEFRVRTPIDVHPMATEYRSLASDDDRLRYLYRKTEVVRERVQAGVDDISRAHGTMRIVEETDSSSNGAGA